MSKRADAYDQGAQHRRAGVSLDRTMQNFVGDEAKTMAAMGWRTQQAHPREVVTCHFFLTHAGCKVCSANQASKEKVMTTRTAEELQQLRTDYEAVYNPYAEGERAAGREPEPFDAAFQAHLETLDAEAAGQAAPSGVAGGEAATGKATGKKAGGKKAGGAKATGATKPKAEAKPKAAKEPKPKGFRPAADDRKTVNAAAAAALKAAKVEGTPRLKVGADPYVEFLQGRALKLDANGNGSLDLNVVTAADMATVVGVVTVTVKKGTMTAKGRKA